MYYKKNQLFNLVIQVQGHSDLIVIYNTLPGHNTYTNKKYGSEQKYCHGKWHTCMIKKNHLFSLKTKNILHHTRLCLDRKHIETCIQS